MTCKYLWTKKQVLIHFSLCFNLGWRLCLLTSSFYANCKEKYLLCKTGWKVFSISILCLVCFSKKRQFYQFPSILGGLSVFKEIFFDALLKVPLGDDKLPSLLRVPVRSLPSRNGTMISFGFRYSHYFGTHLHRPPSEPRDSSLEQGQGRSPHRP